MFANVKKIDSTNSGFAGSSFNMARNSQMETSNTTVRRSARIAAKSGVAVAETAAPVDKRYRRKQESPKKYVAPTKNRNCCEADCDRVTDAEVNDFLNFINHLASVANASMQNPVQAAPPLAPRRSTRNGGRSVVEDVENKTLRVTTVVEEAPVRHSTRSTRNKNRIVMDESDVEDDNDSLYTPDAREELDDDFEMDDLVDEATLEESEVEEPEEEDEEPVKKRRKVTGGNRKAVTGRGDKEGVNVSKELAAILGISGGSRGMVRNMLFEYMENNNLYTSANGIIVKLNRALKTVYNHEEPKDLVVVYKVVNSILKHHTSVAKKVLAEKNVVEKKPVEKVVAKPVVETAKNEKLTVSKALQKVLGKSNWENKEQVRDALFQYMKDKKLYTKQKDVVRIDDALRTVYDHEENKEVVYKVVNSILKHHVNAEGRGIDTWLTFVREVRERMTKISKNPASVTFRNANLLARDLYLRGYDSMKHVSDSVFLAEYNNVIANSRSNRG